MATKVDPHIDAETIEQYSRGDLPAKRAVRAEEHFLVCQPCRAALEASDAYVNAMRQAAAKLRQAERKPKSKAARKAIGPR